MFAIGALPALLVFYLRAYVQEPQVARRTRAKAQAAGDLPKLSEIFQGPILKTTILASLVATGCQGGYYTIFFWVPRFLTTERKLSIVGSTGYLSMLIIGSFVGYLVGVGSRINTVAAISSSPSRWARLRWCWPIPSSTSPIRSSGSSASRSASSPRVISQAWVRS